MKKLTIMLEAELLTPRSGPVPRGRQKQFPVSKAERATNMKQAIRALRLGLVAVVCLFFPVADGYSQNAIVSNVSWTGNAGVSTGETLGYGFNVGSQPISIYSLGLWSWNDTTSWVEGSQLGVWDSSGSLVASVTLPASPSLVLDSIVYENITPVVLNANSTYSIGFYNTGQMIMGGTFAPGPDITIDYPQMSFYASGLSFPNQVLSVYGNVPWLGANALYDIVSVPEPSTARLVAVLGSLMGAWFLRRIQTKPQAC